MKIVCTLILFFTYQVFSDDTMMTTYLDDLFIEDRSVESEIQTGHIEKDKIVDDDADAAKNKLKIQQRGNLRSKIFIKKFLKGLSLFLPVLIGAFLDWLKSTVLMFTGVFLITILNFATREGPKHFIIKQERPKEPWEKYESYQNDPYIIRREWTDGV